MGGPLPQTILCCCEEDCIIDSDNFNRANSGSLGSKWEDLDSNWTIDDQKAASSGNGVAKFLTPHPVPDESMVVYCETAHEVENSGTKYRLLVNVLDDENYHFAEFTRQGANNSTLAIGKVTGGVASIYKIDTILGLTNTSRQIVIRFAPREFCATVSNVVLSLVAAPPDIIAGGYYCGIESVNGHIRIDNFVFEHHQITKNECDSCLCQCNGQYIPPVLTASLSGMGRMSGLDIDVTLLWNRTNSRWESEVFTACSTTWQLFFLCPEDPDDGGTAKLVVNLGCNNSDGFGTAARLPSSSNCIPLSWTFGAYTVSIFDFACGCGLDFVNSGTYTVVVTI